MTKKILKKRVILIILVIVLSTVLASTGYGAYIKLNAMSSPALKLVISTNMSDNGTVQVNNMTFDQTTVSFMYKKGNSEVTFPDINVAAKKLNSEPISYWAAKPRPDTEGVYELMVVFIEGKEPIVNDTLFLPVRLTNYKGDILYKTTAFYQWT